MRPLRDLQAFPHLPPPTPSSCRPPARRAAAGGLLALVAPWGLVGLLSAAPVAAEPAPPARPLALAAQADAALVPDCSALARQAWPRSPAAQLAWLRRMEALADACHDHPHFLAALGGAWLELGDARQALLRLERALLLMPELAVAQADHALALAALGEPTARQELLAAWQGRPDVPQALWRRLLQTLPDDLAPAPDPLRAEGISRRPDVTSLSPLPAPEARVGDWVHRREVQWLLGHETNLTQSPRLGELTVTPPDGPVTLPLATPLQPRAGWASLLDLAWQTAYNPTLQHSVLLGLQASARHAPQEQDTNWHSLRLAAGGLQRIGRWRWMLQGRAHLTGGPVTEDSLAWRTSLAAEGPAWACSQRWLLESDRRHYRDRAEQDGRRYALSGGLFCAVPGTGGWTAGLAARRGRDEAHDATRAGGDQDQSEISASLQGTLGGGNGRPWYLEAQWRVSRQHDRLGYSPLLENNARRRLKTQEVHLDATGPWFGWPQHRAESLVQVLLSRQDSNLPVFGFDAVAVYAGVRFKW